MSDMLNQHHTQKFKHAPIRRQVQSVDNISQSMYMYSIPQPSQALQEKRGWYTLLVHAPDLLGNTSWVNTVMISSTPHFLWGPQHMSKQYVVRDLYMSDIDTGGKN